MTQEEAANKVQEINELKGHEMYDTLEDIWVIVIKAESLKGKKNQDIYYVCVELKPLYEDLTLNVSYDYFREHVKVNKLHWTPIKNSICQIHWFLQTWNKKIQICRLPFYVFPIKQQRTLYVWGGDG